MPSPSSSLASSMTITLEGHDVDLEVGSPSSHHGGSPTDEKRAAERTTTDDNVYEEKKRRREEEDGDDEEMWSPDGETPMDHGGSGGGRGPAVPESAAGGADDDDDDAATPSHGGNALDRQTTRASQKSIPPPDGGTRAWVTCICAHVIIANTWGLINSFGIFQAYYSDFLGLPPSQISWIGSLQILLSNILAIPSGRLTDAGYFRTAIAIGTALQTIGTFGTSFCTQYWQLMLAQGVAFGSGAGFLCCPMLSTTSTFFERRRGLALGIVTTGNVTGGLIYPAMARQLLPRLGLGWAMRAMAFMQLATTLAVNLIVRQRIRPRKTGPLIDWSTLREADFMLYAVGLLFSQSGTYVILYYLPQFSRTQVHPNFSYPDSLNLLLIFNGISIFGRLTATAFADRVGALNLMIPAILCSGIMGLGWMGVRGPAGVYAWTVVYAIVGTALLALFPAGVVSLSGNARTAGSRMGLAFAVAGFSVLVGPPIGGAIISHMGGRYIGAQAYAAGLLMLGGTLVLGAKLARMERAGTNWKAKI